MLSAEELELRAEALLAEVPDYIWNGERLPVPVEEIADTHVGLLVRDVEDLTAKLAFEVGEAIYNKKPIRNIALEIDAKGGAVAVPKLSATLPGDMVLQAQSTLTGDAVRPGVTGQFSLVGPKLRETLSWLAVDLSSVPPAKLQVRAIAPNLLEASAPFVYLPEFSGLAFLHVWNGIQEDVFPRRFKAIIEAA